MHVAFPVAIGMLANQLVTPTSEFRHYMGATLALPETKANSVVSVPLVRSLPPRKATAVKMSCELFPNNCNSSPSTVPWK